MSFPFPTETVTEGLASVIVPKLSLYAKDAQYVPSLAPVFYNPKMKLNRDMAVLVLRAFQRRLNRPIRVGEPLAGCGVRGIRFAREIPEVECVALNDLNPLAARLMERNVADNDVVGRVTVTSTDANTFLALHASPKERFDVVDVDPYGSPSRFLEGALRSLNNKGLLAATATDTAPLCGVNPRACLRKYHGKPLRTEYCRELGIRLILNSIVLTAAKYDLGVGVLLTHATDHYLRVYVQVTRGAQRADASIDQLGYVLHCFHCLYRTWIHGLTPVLDLRCPVCGGRIDVAGPLWVGPLIEGEFCKDMLAEDASLERRVSQLLRSLVEEADAPPAFYVVDKVCDMLNLPIPPKREALEELKRRGYFAGGTHFHPAGLKTDASVTELSDVLAKLRAR